MSATGGSDPVRPVDPVARVMQWPVATVESRTALSEVAEALAASEVGAVPVLSAGRLVGVVSERDVVAHVATGADLSHLTAGEVMATEVVTAQKGDSVLEAARRMSGAAVRHLPVLSEGELAGMVSIRDLLDVFAHAPEPRVPRAREARHGAVVSPPWAG